MLEGNLEEGQGFWNKLLSVVNKGKEEVVRSSRISKFRLELSSLKRERERIFERLGEEVYSRFKGKKGSLPGCETFFTEIEAINFRVSSKEKEMNDVAGRGEGIPQPVFTKAGTALEKRVPYYKRKKRAYPPSGKPDQGQKNLEAGARRKGPSKTKSIVERVETNSTMGL